MTSPAPIPAVVTVEFLHDLWTTLNSARVDLELKPYSYGFLADIARSAKAIPGEPVDVSKSTVYAVMRGSYTSATASAIRQRLAECINVKIQDLLSVYPHAKIQSGSGVSPLNRETKTPRKRRTPIIIRRRCSIQGYITWRTNTYFLGSAFAGEVCTIAPLRDRAHGIRVTTDHASRDAHPVDATNNQLGYEVLN